MLPPLSGTLRKASSGLNGGGAKIPHPEYNITVQYSSSPDNVDKLAARTFRVIDSLKTYAPNDADMQKVKEQIIRARETGIKTNAYWASNIAGRDQSGESIAGLMSDYDAMVKALTPKEIQEAAQQYFNTKQYVKVVLLPSGSTP